MATLLTSLGSSTVASTREPKRNGSSPVFSETLIDVYYPTASWKAVQREESYGSRGWAASHSRAALKPRVVWRIQDKEEKHYSE